MARLGELQQLQRRGEEIARIDDKANDLWTHLPSYAEAQKHHGEYAVEFAPTVADIIHEATLVIAQTRGYTLSNTEEAEWFTCPCDEHRGRV